MVKKNQRIDSLMRSACFIILNGSKNIEISYWGGAVVHGIPFYSHFSLHPAVLWTGKNSDLS
jgi:hypothetical protein